jgi:putative transposase
VEFPVATVCQVLSVSRSGYYDWLRRSPSPRQLANQKLLLAIAQVHAQSRQTYGSPRVTQSLKRQSHACGRHRVARLMRRAGLQACSKRAFRPKTTQGRHQLPIAPNRLGPESVPTGPNRVWVGDITYIATAQGWLYLAAVMDLWSRKVVGWATADHLKTELIQEALHQALRARRPPPGMIHHSDRGIQYASESYRACLRAHGLVASMSAAGHCYDNASMEAFWSTLKSELIHRRDWQSHAEVKLALFDYLETFYNPRRLHSGLHYRSPVEFEKQHAHDRCLSC